MNTKPEPPPKPNFDWHVSVSSMDDGFCVTVERGMSSLMNWHRRLSFKEKIIFGWFNPFNIAVLQYPKTEKQLKISIQKAYELCDEMNNGRIESEKILSKLGL
jgi:hypothetical protein